MLENVQQDAHKWDVGDTDDTLRLKIRQLNEGKNLSFGGDEVLLNQG